MAVGACTAPPGTGDGATIALAVRLSFVGGATGDKNKIGGPVSGVSREGNNTNKNNHKQGTLQQNNKAKCQDINSTAVLLLFYLVLLL